MSRKNFSFKQLVLHTASLAKTLILPMPSPLSRQTHATRQALRHNTGMAEGKACWMITDDDVFCITVHH